MPRLPDPLPPQFLDRTFTTRAATEADVPRKRLRARDLDAGVHGVRVHNGSTDELLARCRAYAVRLRPDVFFSHSTAARLIGAPIPRRLERLVALHASIEAPLRAPHAKGLLGHSRRLAPGDVVEFEGIRISSPQRMWCEMGRVLDLYEFVALTDHLIHHRRQLTTREQLAERLTFGDRITSARVLRPGIELADDRAESPPESRLRVICVLAGLPAPTANYELVDTVTGRGMRLDLAWPELKFAIEYQGDYHRTAAQWRRDMTRRERLRLAGWTILEVNADDLGAASELIQRIRERLAS